MASRVKETSDLLVFQGSPVCTNCCQFGEIGLAAGGTSVLHDTILNGKTRHPENL